MIKEGKMKKSVKRILLGVAAAAAIACGAYMLLAPTQVPMTQVTPKTAELAFTVQGTMAGNRVIQIYPVVQGALIHIAVSEGQYVRAGDVICTIDPEIIEQKISQVHSAISGYQAQMQVWEEEHTSQNRTTEENQALQALLIEQGEKDLEQAQRELERISFLYEDGSLALTDVEQAQTAVDLCELALQTRRQELSILSGGGGGTQMRAYYQALIDIERANLTLLEKDLEHTVITAVSDGIITALPVQDTNYVSAGQSVAELTVADQLHVETYVSTNDIDSVALGDSVRLILSRRGGDITFSGTVSHIDSTAEMMISALGLEERRVKVEITPDLSSLEASIGSGYDVDVQFLLYQEDGQLAVPKTALFQVDGGDMLWVAEHGVLQAVEVTKGMELRTEFVILSGLAPDSFVVTDANNDALKDGLRVAMGG